MKAVKRNEYGHPELIAKEERWKEFLEWVERTKLFVVIKETSNEGWRGFPTTILAHSTVNTGPMILEMKPGIKVNKAEDLPTEMLLEFYKNSPFYTEEAGIINITENLKLLE